MLAKGLLHTLNDAAARLLGIKAVRLRNLYPWQLRAPQGGSRGSSALPEGAHASLRPDNPRLEELRRRYRQMDARVTTPASWIPGKLSAHDLVYFRGDNAFVWQTRDLLRHNELAYALTYYALKAGPAADLLDRLAEDDAFGVNLVEVDGRQVSRDLLDSASEIHFLQKHAGLGSTSLNLLDIGAGYGRLEHRIGSLGLPGVRIFATDAVPESTFIAEFYLAFRRTEQAIVVPLDEVDALLASTRIDLALNVHSFSECTPEAIAWWMEKLAAHEVKRLLVVPNAGRSGGARCETNLGFDMETIFSRFGYEAAVREPRFADPTVQTFGIDPVHLHLFERSR